MGDEHEEEGICDQVGTLSPPEKSQEPFPLRPNRFIDVNTGNDDQKDVPNMFMAINTEIVDEEMFIKETVDNLHVDELKSHKVQKNFDLIRRIRHKLEEAAIGINFKAVHMYGIMGKGIILIR